MSKIIRPTGIIRTLPSLYGAASVGAKRYRKSITMLEREQIPAIYIALQAIPKYEILHMYLLTDGEINVRLNIAGYESGEARECWDKTIRKPEVLGDLFRAGFTSRRTDQTERVSRFSVYR